MSNELAVITESVIEAELVGGTELAVSPENALMMIFTDRAKMDDKFADLRAKVESFVGDVSTKAGRAEMRSFAANISKERAQMDRDKKALTKDVRDKLTKINHEGHYIDDLLKGFRETVRKKLTDFENAKKEREDSYERTLVLMQEYKFEHVIMTSTDAERFIIDLKALYASHDWQEFKDRADHIFNMSHTFLVTKSADLLKAEKQAIELETLRKEKAERDQKEREDRIAKEAAEAATAEAERIAEEKKAKVERQAEEKRQADEKTRVAAEKKAEDARLETERKAKKEKDDLAKQLADAEQKIADEKQEAKEKEQRAELARIADKVDKQDALDKAEKDKQDAIQAERDRAEKQKADEEKAAKLREEDESHKRSINKGMLKALMDCRIDEQTAMQVITVIAQGKIPNITISY